eukprot:XP_001702875.1 predicted protein [Chlamydomonas reinhardtii]
MYEKVKVGTCGGGGGGKPTRPPRRPWTTLTGITLLRLYWWPMVHESLWVLVEVGQRLGTPVALREFLRWLQVLRLNSASVTAVSSGHVVNLVSNDVRRFDDVMPFWIFLWAAPLELAMVLLMVSLELDFVSALAGVATSMAMIPIQSALVRYIGGLRRNTARCTDERVRLAGEVVEGALAMKMLSWEVR